MEWGVSPTLQSCRGVARIILHAPAIATALTGSSSRDSTEARFGLQLCFAPQLLDKCTLCSALYTARRICRASIAHACGGKGPSGIGNSRRKAGYRYRGRGLAEGWQDARAAALGSVVVPCECGKALRQRLSEHDDW